MGKKDDDDYLEFLRYQEVDASNVVHNPKKPSKRGVKRVVRQAERELKRKRR